MSQTLNSRIVAVSKLSMPQRQQMISLMRQVYEGVRTGRFERDLTEKQYVILLLRRIDGELVGFSTLRVAREQVNGTGCEVVFSGDTVIHPEYWGQKELQKAFARFTLWRVLRNPFRPVYWLLLSAGFKTYLLMVHHFPYSLPKHDRKPPAGELDLLDGLATRWFGAQYDPSQRILRFTDPHYRVREGLAPIDEEALKDPDIAFFAGRNPGHGRGDELVCLARLRAMDLIWVIVQVLWRRIARKFRTPEKGAQSSEGQPRRFAPGYEQIPRVSEDRR